MSYCVFLLLLALVSQSPGLKYPFLNYKNEFRLNKIKANEKKTVEDITDALARLEIYPINASKENINKDIKREIEMTTLSFIVFINNMSESSLEGFLYFSEKYKNPSNDDKVLKMSNFHTKINNELNFCSGMEYNGSDVEYVLDYIENLKKDSPDHRDLSNLDCLNEILAKSLEKYFSLKYSLDAEDSKKLKTLDAELSNLVKEYKSKQLSFFEDNSTGPVEEIMPLGEILQEIKESLCKTLKMNCERLKNIGGNFSEKDDKEN